VVQCLPSPKLFISGCGESDTSAAGLPDENIIYDMVTASLSGNCSLDYNPDKHEESPLAIAIGN
jgi:hypothetical protein